ncbi:MAG: type II toxin-antitoxin system VapC family toxin [Saprospiraceae bacterium]
MVIVDTHIFVWDILSPQKLSRKALHLIESESSNNELCVCDITFWEMGLFVNKGRLELDRTVSEFIEFGLAYRNYQVLSITPTIAEVIAQFAVDINNDPADRIISAAAICYNYRLITADKNLIGFKPLKTIW